MSGCLGGRAPDAAAVAARSPAARDERGFTREEPFPPCNGVIPNGTLGGFRTHNGISACLQRILDPLDAADRGEVNTEFLGRQYEIGDLRLRRRRRVGYDAVTRRLRCGHASVMMRSRFGFNTGTTLHSTATARSAARSRCGYGRLQLRERGVRVFRLVGLCPRLTRLGRRAREELPRHLKDGYTRGGRVRWSRGVVTRADFVRWLREVVYSRWFRRWC